MTSATDEGPRTVVRLHLNHFLPTNPSSPPLPTETILLHGLGVSGAVWAGFARRFLARPVIAPDLRGHGASDPAPLPHQYTPTDYAADVLALLDASGTGEPGTVIGHSLGSLIALAMAKAEPSRIKRLILIDPPLDPTISNEVVGEVARLRNVPPGPLEDYLATFHGEVAARSLARLFRCAAPGTLETYIASPRGAPWAWHAASELNVPVLILQADVTTDGALGDDAANRFTRLLPRGTLIKIPGASHAIHASHPREAVAHIDQFIAST